MSLHSDYVLPSIKIKLNVLIIILYKFIICQVISQSEFIYGAIDPDESNDLKDQIRRLFAEEDGTEDISSYFTAGRLLFDCVAAIKSARLCPSSA